MRGVSVVLAGNTLFAGIIISNLAFIGTLIALYHYTIAEVGDQKVARRTVIYLLSAPTAFFFLSAYTESLFLFLSILSLLALKRERWVLAGIMGGLASLTRLPGVLLVLPMVYAAWNQYKQGAGKFVWISSILTLCGAAIFPLYLYLSYGLPLWTPINAQAARTQGMLAFPGANILEALQQIVSGTNYMSDIWDVFFIGIFLLLALFVWSKLSRISNLYYLPLLALYLVREGGVQPLIGMARYILVLFPGFIILGIWGSNRWVHRLILYPSWLLLLFMSGQFAIWGWVG
jgi:Gpi18-like mannosyltransferase